MCLFGIKKKEGHILLSLEHFEGDLPSKNNNNNNNNKTACKFDIFAVRNCPKNFKKGIAWEYRTQ